MNCPPETPYLSDYGPDAICVAVDPCLPDGTTLWGIQACTPEVHTFTPISRVPVRDLPDTGINGALLPSAGLLLAVGLLLTVWARRARPKRTQRYVVTMTIGGEWGVFDSSVPGLKFAEVSFDNRDAAKHYAQVLNANLTPLSAPEEDK